MSFTLVFLKKCCLNCNDPFLIVIQWGHLDGISVVLSLAHFQLKQVQRILKGGTVTTFLDNQVFATQSDIDELVTKTLAKPFPHYQVSFDVRLKLDKFSCVSISSKNDFDKNKKLKLTISIKLCVCISSCKPVFVLFVEEPNLILAELNVNLTRLIIVEFDYYLLAH